jgi:hypothetical protein
MTVPIKFVLDKEESTSDPMVEVLFSTDQPAKPGTYEFQLVVVDDQGVASAPATLRLVLQGSASAQLHIVNADGRPVDQTTFRIGSQIFLSAKGSASENGAIKAFVWKLTARP